MASLAEAQELPRETETKLVVRSSEPVRDARRVWSLRNVSTFRLEPRRALDLRDTYFDTPDRRLSRAGQSLRIRRGERTLLVALKGPTTATGRRAPQRTEVESRLSREALSRLRELLEREGISVGDPPSSIRPPERALSEMGFVILLDRATRRIRRDVKRKPSPDKRANLTIDGVADSVDSMTVRHYEIEIEAAGSDFDAVTQLTRDLREVIGSGLMPFRHSKLAIGLALRELEQRGKLHRYVGPNGFLLPAAWNAIDRVLVAGPMTSPPD